MREALEVRVRLHGRRAAQLAGGTRECFDRNLLDCDGRIDVVHGWAGDAGHLYERAIECDIASLREYVVELAGLRERRDAKERRQPARCIKTFASLDLRFQRERRAEMRIHAAPAFRLAGRKPHEPAVEEKLLLRLQRIERGLLDARRIASHGTNAS